MKRTELNLTLVPTSNAIRGSDDDDFYVEVDQQRAGYIYRSGDDTWTVGVMTVLNVGDIGPFAQGLPSRTAAVEFAKQHLPVVDHVQAASFPPAASAGQRGVTASVGAAGVPDSPEHVDRLSAFEQLETGDVHPEVSLFDVMSARVRAGEPIHIQVPFPDPLGKALLEQIERLGYETGKPVHVIFS